MTCQPSCNTDQGVCCSCKSGISDKRQAQCSGPVWVGKAPDLLQWEAWWKQTWQWCIAAVWHVCTPSCGVTGSFGVQLACWQQQPPGPWQWDRALRASVLVAGPERQWSIHHHGEAVGNCGGSQPPYWRANRLSEWCI